MVGFFGRNRSVRFAVPFVLPFRSICCSVRFATDRSDGKMFGTSGQ
jgi:hypothetical protein